MNEFKKMVGHPVIQNGWEPKVGDICLHKDPIEYKNEPLVIYKIFYFTINKKIEVDLLSVVNLSSTVQGLALKDDIIWCPRLDQLLEMPLGKGFELGPLYPREKVVSWGVRIRPVSGNSMIFSDTILEIALIKAIMHTHGLSWTDGEWKEAK